MKAITKVEYIGDGVYVKVDPYGVVLMAHGHEDPTDTIYLEWPVLDKLFRLVKDRINGSMGLL